MSEFTHLVVPCTCLDWFGFNDFLWVGWDFDIRQTNFGVKLNFPSCFNCADFFFAKINELAIYGYQFLSFGN